MSDRQYQRCVRCVMDTTDPEIRFDDEGICHHCHGFDAVTSTQWHPDAKGAAMLQEKVDAIKAEGKGKDFDCILGLSGGVDSSYLALKVHELGLRPLVVHVDAGWNSELAVFNIERVVNHCGYELHTHVIDWDEVRDLQLSYLKAGVPNQDVIQDHGFFSSMYHFAVKEGIRHVISGGNIATESVFPMNWQHAAMDARNIHAIHRKYGQRKLKNYKTISFFEYYIYYPMIRKMRVLRPLNFMPYDKRLALKELEDVVGYKDYGRKHGESVFTKFFQNYYLPTKFGYDKRLPHLSSIILSGQIDRNSALKELEKPLYDDRELQRDKEYVAKKLQISADELEAMISGKASEHTDFASWNSYYELFSKINNRLSQSGLLKLPKYS